ncbi:uncharacterized protein B0I36DRAFT_253922 [Microdochium trichocladiopsis]|uniref:SWR1-complex protein 3 domain-containing protein n=1 Tax=Microdochium trichocladiopsis TaxID=1682393 RepID=A0A9P8XU34_9PEZI|nr:uncharacterized protein B0I36DRAFT_253922 [Microdochium trichocladiopsis]KAH7018380.1 hypothetical protein B0I36DRAFT_253922 [Microdochium trichocladiopsis]
MERKRKLPARAAARVEQVSKKRTATPPADRSLTPKTATPQPEPVPVPEPAARLPTTISAGAPLPIVDKEQSVDLPNRDYQSVQESGVLSESLSRSRQKWIHEGIFEKYWTKPTKRKGVVKEEPNNPPKDSMVKVGTVTITVEPHVIEATMFAVKDPKPPVPAANAAARPVMQYGPPNGSMPPPPRPTASPTPTKQSPKPGLTSAAQNMPPTAQGTVQPQASPSQTPTPQRAQLPSESLPSPQRTTPGTPAVAHSDIQPTTSRAPSTPASNPSSAAPQGPGPVLAVSQMPASIPDGAPGAMAPVVKVEPGQPRPIPPHPQHTTPIAAGPNPSASNGAVKPGTPNNKPGANLQPGADPIIVTLAEKASHDPQLRDLMKRVAVGEASPAELKHFQGIIDQITIDYKKKNPPNPKAEALVVTGTGKTVKYFADEVRNILNIVLSSNPAQRSSDLRVPVNSDPLVIHLVKKALDVATFRESIFRVANGRTQQADANEIKNDLEKFMLTLRQQTQTHSRAGSEHIQNGQGPLPVPGTVATPIGKVRKTSQTSQSPGGTPSQQALRSKGPPPASRMDISAVVLEFAGGTSDRYLFPKFSILEQTSPHEVVASFLIVRKGSKSEYGGDPALDYYQPVTIRLNSPTARHLDHFFRVVAPVDEVQRYMDDVMDNMTRAEYVLLAMRLPRTEKDTSIPEAEADSPIADALPKAQAPGVLWTSKPPAAVDSPVRARSLPRAMDEDDHYQKFISTVS